MFGDGGNWFKTWGRNWLWSISKIFKKREDPWERLKRLCQILTFNPIQKRIKNFKPYQKNSDLVTEPEFEPKPKLKKIHPIIYPVHKFKPGTQIKFSNKQVCVIQKDGSMRNINDPKKSKAVKKAEKRARRVNK
jgi:hypothetical protein